MAGAKFWMGALAVVLGLTFGAGPSAAQSDWQAEWQATIAKAKGQKLVLALMPGDGFEQTVEDFQRKFPDIDVQTTIEHPSQMAPRLVTEQKNGVFEWDSWWGTASNMNNVLLPLGGFEKITDYMILPEVKDPANWHSPQYLYTSPRGPYVFVHTHFLQSLALYNSDLLPGKTFTSLDELLDPVLVGKISIRVPSRPHGGQMTLAAIAKEKGLDFVRKLFTDMQPRFVDNDRQITMDVMKGETAVAVGVADDLYVECQHDGGCQNVHFLPVHYMHSRGVAVLKNAPHKEATKVWINWLLSKQGQEAYVRDWAKFNVTGAFSMRRDVAPDPKHLSSMPDMDHLDKYVAVSLDSGKPELDAIGKLYSDVRK